MNINEAIFPVLSTNKTTQQFGHGSMLQLHSERERHFARLSFIELKLWRYFVGQ